MLNCEKALLAMNDIPDAYIESARAMLGYLLVRGGVHIVAYAKALEKLTGVDVGKLLPIPDISNKRFPEAKKHEAKGLHQILYRFSPNDYKEITQIWTGTHPEDGSKLRVEDGPPDRLVYCNVAPRADEHAVFAQRRAHVLLLRPEEPRLLVPRRA